jgi:hypothetical protein
MRKKNKIIKIKHVYYEYDYVDTILEFIIIGGICYIAYNLFAPL